MSYLLTKEESCVCYSHFSVRDLCECVLNGYGLLIDSIWSLIHPLQIAWALVPMSFVADWFIQFDRAVANFEKYLSTFASGIKPLDGAWEASRLRPYFGTTMADSYEGRCEIVDPIYANWDTVGEEVLTGFTLRYTFNGFWSKSTVDLRPATRLAFVRQKFPDHTVVGAFLPYPKINLSVGKIISGLALLVTNIK